MPLRVAHAKSVRRDIVCLIMSLVATTHITYKYESVLYIPVLLRLVNNRRLRVI